MSDAPSAPDADLGPLDALVPVILHELRAMAHRQLAREGDILTLQTTDLVHEAWLRLRGHPEVTRRGRAYFYGAAARAMRRVLVDAARKRRAAKRVAPAADALPAPAPDVDAYALELIALDDALARLGEANPRGARVVECRYFGGLTIEETAAALGISPATVKHDWADARAWLWRALHGGDGDAPPQ